MVVQVGSVGEQCVLHTKVEGILKPDVVVPRQQDSAYNHRSDECQRPRFIRTEPKPYQSHHEHGEQGEVGPATGRQSEAKPRSRQRPTPRPILSQRLRDEQKSRHREAVARADGHLVKRGARQQKGNPPARFPAKALPPNPTTPGNPTARVSPAERITHTKRRSPIRSEERRVGKECRSRWA